MKREKGSKNQAHGKVLNIIKPAIYAGLISKWLSCICVIGGVVLLSKIKFTPL
jgi:hypothetical protein